jgi:heat-inducible transcriptional repressor
VKSVELRDKEKRVLVKTVERYLISGMPVSSASVSKMTPSHMPPATVRYIMSKLEGKGLLKQPHTSSGRIPTDNGLRLYVGFLFEEATPHDSSINLPFEDDFFLRGEDFSTMLTKVSDVLSEHSDNLGFVLSPRLSRLYFKHLRFIKIAEQKVMVILITTFNVVLTDITETRAYFTQVELDRAARYINDNFRGKNLVFVRDYLMKEVPKFRAEYEQSINKLIGLLRAYIFREDETSQIFIKGTSRLVGKPDLFEMDRLRLLFQNFEEKAKLAKLLSDFISLDKVKVLIGTDLDMPAVSDCALILSHYGDQNQILGSLGIIGPKRISYKKIIPLVDHVAKQLSQTISQSH